MPLVLGDMSDDKTAVRVGAPAPDFSLVNERGEEWRLSDKRGRVVALLFYPGDETLVCTRQMCSVCDHWAKYVETGAEIVGISRGTIESHQHFALRHGLPLSLLTDPDRGVTEMYSNHPLLPSWATRALTVIDAKDVVHFHRVMLKVFRPTDKEMLTAIHRSRFDALSALI